ncbi:hypothetical protein EDD90_2732 [Streptomyces sp. Ag109_O5-1]|uniref:hypothetical protein n=1 Tax=Streptomyces sp. Ag109_O5-1 TaxID=1938851 RepID=UPI000F4F7D2F|nr:hypothetical protein [Streptomyces sp. Ag109_O5-1]RPE39715.1 hypothetical protein EDD90_2732 [Streptomyces sp. Ag109_O5-1]
MALTLPTPADVQALYDFIIERVEEEWAAINGDEPLHEDHFEAAQRFYRISNSNKLALAGTAAYLHTLLKTGDTEQATLAWNYLTQAGEQWRDHPDHLADWENPQMAQVRALIGG